MIRAMGSLKLLLFGLCLALAASAAPLSAQSLPQDPLRLFAACTGRLSALMEYQWLVQDPAAPQTEARRDAMADLLQAALPLGAERHAMDLRLQAKAAEAALLRQALGRDGDWALRRALTQVAGCTALLLS